ncbi:MAG TPA: GNAT family N-acetyltransferase [Gaiellales bacterium]|nr:GNAT family N-acetyltransferase [Gaiellales bacterium]
MTAAIDVRRLRPQDGPACDTIVASLPYHFGVESGQEACAAAVRREDGLAALTGGEIAGFLTWRPWYRTSREITWMAVHANRRGAGIGRALLEHLAAQSAKQARYLVVTTLSEATPEPGVADGYARTRRFYERNGFEPVWEPAGWWNDENQAVVMVRSLA